MILRYEMMGAGDTICVLSQLRDIPEPTVSPRRFQRRSGLLRFLIEDVE